MSGCGHRGPDCSELCRETNYKGKREPAKVTPPPNNELRAYPIQPLMLTPASRPGRRTPATP